MVASGVATSFISIYILSAAIIRGIEYCIEQGIDYFDPGAQGEHKLSRGFLPCKTWSAHWLAQPGFVDAIAHFLKEEGAYIDAYQADLMKHSPYRTTGNAN